MFCGAPPFYLNKQSQASLTEFPTDSVVPRSRGELGSVKLRDVEGIVDAPTALLDNAATFSQSGKDETGRPEGPEMRTIFRVFVWLIFFVLSGTAGSAEKVRVSFPTLGPGFTPAWITAEAGYWKKQGLDVELVLLSGGARVIPALLSNSVQMVLGSVPA